MFKYFIFDRMWKENCKKKYVGLTQQQFRDRMYQHIGYVMNKKLASGVHLNFPGVLLLLYGREREKLIKKSLIISKMGSIKSLDGSRTN